MNAPHGNSDAKAVPLMPSDASADLFAQKASPAPRFQSAVQLTDLLAGSRRVLWHKESNLWLSLLVLIIQALPTGLLAG